ncbi:hypothetical protein VNO77_01952 [Canavalia gladiata]|uniref:Uncharacterized protein n=1 Tax=Canavalia gladiata TaxID=3824 RepID=A0AAN9MS38_CANGL
MEGSIRGSSCEALRRGYKKEDSRIHGRRVDAVAVVGPCLYLAGLHNSNLAQVPCLPNWVTPPPCNWQAKGLD